VVGALAFSTDNKELVFLAVHQNIAKLLNKFFHPFFIVRIRAGEISRYCL
jgi:hypothetical protein